MRRWTPSGNGSISQRSLKESLWKWIPRLMSYSSSPLGTDTQEIRPGSTTLTPDLSAYRGSLPLQPARWTDCVDLRALGLSSISSGTAFPLAVGRTLGKPGENLHKSTYGVVRILGPASAPSTAKVP